MDMHFFFLAGPGNTQVLQLWLTRTDSAILKIRIGNYCVTISVSISHPKYYILATQSILAAVIVGKYEFKVGETTIQQDLSSITGKATCQIAHLLHTNAAHFSKHTDRLVTILPFCNREILFCGVEFHSGKQPRSRQNTRMTSGSFCLCAPFKCYFSDS